MPGADIVVGELDAGAVGAAQGERCVEYELARQEVPPPYAEADTIGPGAL